MTNILTFLFKKTRLTYCFTLFCVFYVTLEALVDIFPLGKLDVSFINS